MNNEIIREDLNFILQMADLEKLKKLYEDIKNKFRIDIIQAPTQQTLLQPIKDPISKGEFYGGEVLVTTTIVVLKEIKSKGWAMVLDDNKELSLYIATCDAVFGAGYFKNDIKNLIEDTNKNIEIKEKEQNRKVNSTRVNFDLM